MNDIDFIQKILMKPVTSKHKKVFVKYKGKRVKVNVSNSHKRLSRAMSKKKHKLYILADQFIDRVDKPHLFGINQHYLSTYLRTYFDLCIDEIMSENLIINKSRVEAEIAFKKIIKSKTLIRKINQERLGFLNDNS